MRTLKIVTASLLFYIVHVSANDCVTCTKNAAELEDSDIPIGAIVIGTNDGLAHCVKGYQANRDHTSYEYRMDGSMEFDVPRNRIRLATSEETALVLQWAPWICQAISDENISSLREKVLQKGGS